MWRPSDRPGCTARVPPRLTRRRLGLLFWTGLCFGVALAPWRSDSRRGPPRHKGRRTQGHRGHRARRVGHARGLRESVDRLRPTAPSPGRCQHARSPPPGGDRRPRLVLLRRGFVRSPRDRLLGRPPATRRLLPGGPVAAWHSIPAAAPRLRGAANLEKSPPCRVFVLKAEGEGFEPSTRPYDV
jgi:hypothetical protein